MTLIKKILTKVRGTLFDTLYHDELMLIDAKEQKLREAIQEHVQARTEMYKARNEAQRKAQSDPSNWVKGALHLFGPYKDLDTTSTENIIEYATASGMEEKEFLSKTADIYKNPAFKIILKYLTREQILVIADSVQYQENERAVLTGFMAVDNEVTKIHNLYVEEKENEGEFEEEEERYTVM